jgi:hypothetical protein
MSEMLRDVEVPDVAPGFIEVKRALGLLLIIESLP